MGNSQTTKTNQTQNQQFNQQYSGTNKYDFLNPPDTADVAALRSHQFQVDPTIGYRVGSAVRRIGSQFSNPLGQYATPSMKAQIMRSQEQALNQQAGEQFREGAYDVNNQEYGKKLAVAGMTSPRLVQTGTSGTSSGTQSGTSSGTATTSEPWYNGAIQGAAGIGSALLM